MDIKKDQHFHPIEALIAAAVLGFILVGCAVSLHRSLAREHDAMRSAALVGARLALEEYAHAKGQYPDATTPINLANGCVDAEGGVYSKAGRGNCTATLFAVSSQAQVVYQSSADRKGYALRVQEDLQPTGIVLCGTPQGVRHTGVCTPTARNFIE